MRFISLVIFLPTIAAAQLSNRYAVVTADTATGVVNIRFASGQTVDNATAYVVDLRAGRVSTTDCRRHACRVTDGYALTVTHTGNAAGLTLIQHITLQGEGLLLDLEVKGAAETRHISPLAAVIHTPGTARRLLDVPFDNDDWVHILEQRPPANPAAFPVCGMSYEYTTIYDSATLAGLVLGSVTHDFWKTGIAYRMGQADTLDVFGGVSTPDDPSKPLDEGRDGTHDHAPHVTMLGPILRSPKIYIAAGKDVRPITKTYGEVNAKINGRLAWNGPAPVYWNSFGVEGVLGYGHVMMPDGVKQVSDVIKTLDRFNRAAVLSIDSYDQGVYSTETLKGLKDYAAKNRQRIGFYFAPFAQWYWKDRIASAPLAQAILKDSAGNPIAYKDGDWAAFALDPTHPAVRDYLVGQLEKAKTIGATFIKIDFLSAGTQESPTHANPAIRTGIQAFNYGMRLLRHLSDSILGPDIFYTEAISPLFPSQYTHARFISTDIYSHLRDDQTGFPNWGSTEYSLALGSHMTWTQGTLWPYTNLDVTIMEHFQKNPTLTETEVKVRLLALVAMGSILGDGSDLRSPLALERARQYLNNPKVCAYFAHPRAFTPLQWADGPGFDQQLVFTLGTGAKGRAGAPTLLALFNFSRKSPLEYTLPAGKATDFLTGAPLPTRITIPTEDAKMIEIWK